MRTAQSQAGPCGDASTVEPPLAGVSPVHRTMERVTEGQCSLATALEKDAWTTRTSQIRTET